MKKKLVRTGFDLCLTFLMAVLFVHQGAGQTSKYAKPVLTTRELKVGDYLPDFPLGLIMDNMGHVSDNYQGKKKLSDFKSKLIIFDFWNTYCSSCIEGFPKMSKLQKEFGDSIQIFLVNNSESPEKVKSTFKKRKLSDLFPGNLPVLYQNTILENFFPPKSGTGYHVWIGNDRKIIIRGLSFNTYSSKIVRFLQEKEVDFIKDDASQLDSGGAFDKSRALSQLIGNTREPLLIYSSLLTKYSDELGYPYPSGYHYKGSYNSFNDNRLGAYIETYRNTSVVQLYQASTESLMENEKIIFGNRSFLEVKDKSLYVDTIKYYLNRTDSSIRKCRFNYEQATPLSLTSLQREEFMLNSLNQYFGAMYAAEGRVKKRVIPCYILTRTSTRDKLKAKGGISTFISALNGKPAMGYTNMPIRETFRSLFLTHGLSGIFSENDILIDESDYTENADLVLNADIRSLSDLNDNLKQFGLSIVKEEREIDVLIIREKSLLNSNQ